MMARESFASSASTCSRANAACFSSPARPACAAASVNSASPSANAAAASASRCRARLEVLAQHPLVRLDLRVERRDLGLDARPFRFALGELEPERRGVDLDEHLALLDAARELEATRNPNAARVPPSDVVRCEVRF